MECIFEAGACLPQTNKVLWMEINVHRPGQVFITMINLSCKYVIEIAVWTFSRKVSYDMSQCKIYKFCIWLQIYDRESILVNCTIKALFFIVLFIDSTVYCLPFPRYRRLAPKNLPKYGFVLCTVWKQDTINGGVACFIKKNLALGVFISICIVV